MTQPLDVLKTRSMNAKPGEFRGALHLISFTASQGPTAFYKVYTVQCSVFNVYDIGSTTRDLHPTNERMKFFVNDVVIQKNNYQCTNDFNRSEK